MRIRLRSHDDTIELECDAYAVFDPEAGLLLVSDHTMISEDDMAGYELVWIV